MIEIDNQADSYLAAVKRMSSSQRKEKLEQIRRLFSKSSEYGDDKVTLAMQTYEMVWTMSGMRIVFFTLPTKVSYFLKLLVMEYQYFSQLY